MKKDRMELKDTRIKLKRCKICGTEFRQYNSLQNKCHNCQLKEIYSKSKPKCKGLKKTKKVNHTVKDKRSEISKLEKYADSLYQTAGKKLFPISVTGEPTEVIHHHVPKSQSNNLRYDFKNACPSTNGWHFRHHRLGDPTLSDAFKKKFGQERIDYLTEQRRITVKQTKERLEKVIKELEIIVYGKPKSLPF